MTERLLPQVSLRSCPYLGMKDDPATAAGFAHPAHRCHAQNGALISMERQNEWCLGSDFRNCRYYPRDTAVAATDGARDRTGRSLRLWLLLSMFTIVSAVTCGVAITRLVDFSDSNGPSQPQAAVADLVETPALLATAATIEPTAEPTHTPAPPTPTMIVTAPTPVNTPTAVAAEQMVDVVVHAAHGRPADSSDPRSGRIWLDTGVVLTGERVELTALGSVTQHDGGQAWSPAGTGSDFCQDPTRPCAAPRLSQFALIGWVEGQRWPFLVGEATSITATGRLFLAFNDGNYDDNCLSDPAACGAWIVTIEGVFQIE